MNDVQTRQQPEVSDNAVAPRLNLVKPAEATGEVAEIFADIRRTKGDKFLTPTWGFFAHDPELLKHWWGLQKRLQKIEGEVPKRIMFGITYLCAAEVGCPRCINNAQVHLQEQFDVTDDDLAEFAQFETSTKITNAEKAVYRFCRKMAFDQPTSEEDFAALRAHGYSDRAIVEMISITILESGFIRRARAVAPFEDGKNWPRENLPSSFYAGNVDSKKS
jgi:hypothetical protein